MKKRKISNIDSKKDSKKVFNVSKSQLKVRTKKQNEKLSLIKFKLSAHSNLVKDNFKVLI